MQRHPDLAHKAGQHPDVLNLRHFAIDKLTSAHIAVGTLNRYQGDAVSELKHEEKMVGMMEDATYYFRLYLREKLKKYEEMLSTSHDEQTGTIVNQANFISKQENELKKFKEGDL